MILTCKTDPDTELRCVQDLLEYRFPYKEINIKSDSAERATELVKTTGHSTGTATNWAS